MHDVSARVDIAGGTIIAFDRKDRRFARLAKGQALFSVRHDEAHPFEVLVDGKRLVDIGTVFDVRRDPDGAMSVAVSEGAVQFDPDDADVRVAPGEILHRRPGATDYTLSALPAERVGEWREGRLTFEAETVEAVAARLTRATGINYAATPGASSDVISGSILVDPLRQDPAAFGLLLGVPVRLENGRWMIGKS
jgi:transmembrane sensor